jgi:mono/diheme cytochrome c family protein
MRKQLFAIVAAICCIAAVSSRGVLLAADLSAARDNFDGQCAKCHGESGRGDGPSGGPLTVRPRDFTDCSRMSKESDERVFSIIKRGGESGGLSKEMPAWGEAFDDDEIKGLIVYVRQFCKPQNAHNK